MNGLEALALVMGQHAQQAVRPKRHFHVVFLLDQTVGVTTQYAAHRHVEAAHVHGRNVPEHAQAHAPLFQQLVAAVRTHKQRRVVPAIDVFQRSVCRVKHSGKKRDVLLALSDLHHAVVQGVKGGAQRHVLHLEQRADLRLKVAHQQRGAHALATHIGHAHHDFA